MVVYAGAAYQIATLVKDGDSTLADDAFCCFGSNIRLSDGFLSGNHLLDCSGTPSLP